MADSTHAIRDTLDQAVTRRHSNRVLHGHPSPSLWLERDVAVDAIAESRHGHPGRARKRLAVYVGSPFCVPTQPDRCGFCLFPSEVYRSPDQLTTYLGYLAKEMDLLRGRFVDDEVAAIYFGGGTTNLYRPRQYAELMDIVRKAFPRTTPDAEVTVEGVAQFFTQKKLEAMRDAGVTRVSMGVQQLDPDLLAFSGRKQNTAHVLGMLEACQSLNIASSVDLIFGWPGQTPQNMLRDLETITSLGVPHITHYELNLAGRTDFSRRQRHQLPPVGQVLEMYRLASEYLIASGYRQATPYDWERVDAGLAGTYRYETFGRSPFLRSSEGQLGGYDVWGCGFAAISFCLGWPEELGWAFCNPPRVDDYYRALDEGRVPTERGYRYTDSDLRLYVLFQMLQGLRVDRGLYTELFGRDPVDEHEPIWEAAAERGWLAIDADALTLVGDGGLYAPLIQETLAATRLEEIRASRRTARQHADLMLGTEPS